MWSFWEKQSFIGKPDLLVVGSGIVGLTAALEYQILHPNHNILVIEVGHLPSGASTKNAGFACYGSPTEILSDLKTDSEDDVVKLIKKRLDGLENLKLLLGEKNIGFQSYGSFELFRDGDNRSFEEASDKLNDLNQLIKPVIGFTPFEIEPNIINKSGFLKMNAAIKINGEGQIDTGKMMSSLLKLVKSKGIKIFNGLNVLSVESNSKGVNILTPHGSIFSKKCIIATNGFARNLLPDIDLLPARAQVLITKPIKNLPFFGTFHFDSGYYYFRNVGNRVLFGGGRNIDFERETTTVNEVNMDIHNVLEKFLKHSILPSSVFEIEHRWTGIMGVGSSKQVILKSIDDHIYIGVRLGGMGVAIGSLIGRDIARMVD